MKKLLILLLLSLSIFLNSKELNVFNIFKLDFDNNIELKKFTNTIYSKGDIVVFSSYVINYKNYNRMVLNFYIRVNKKYNLNDIENYTKIKKTQDNFIFFGMGDIFKTLKNDKKNVEIINLKNGLHINKYITEWASGVSSDLLVYYFKLNHQIFDECLIEFVNIWQTTGKKVPSNLRTPKVNELIKKNNKQIYFYNILDDTVKNIQLLKHQEGKTFDDETENKDIEIVKINETESKKSYFTPIIDNLRLRDFPTLDSKVIRILKRGEKLYFRDIGNTEKINGIEGTWVTVETENGEIGWCFDAYLKPYDEVKKK